MISKRRVQQVAEVADTPVRAGSIADNGRHHDHMRHLLQLPVPAPPEPAVPPPLSSPAQPSSTWVAPSHSCAIIMTGSSSPGVPPSAAAPPRLTLMCSGGVGLEVRLSPWLDSARSRSTGSAPGPNQGPASTAPDVLVQGVAVSDDQLRRPNSSTNGQDWRVVLLCGPGVSHLLLHSSVLADLPLSTEGPLLQLVSCGTLSLSNVTLARLTGSPGASPDALPVYGAVHARGLRQGALLDGMECSGVAGAHTWACFLLGFEEREREGDASPLAPPPSPQQQAGQPPPAAMFQIHNSKLYNNTVSAHTATPQHLSRLLPEVAAALSVGGGCNSSSFGAIVVSSASFQQYDRPPPPGVAPRRTAVVDVVVSNSTLANNTGGCGGALAALCDLVSSSKGGSTINEHLDRRCCLPTCCAISSPLTPAVS